MKNLRLLKKHEQGQWGWSTLCSALPHGRARPFHHVVLGHCFCHFISLLLFSVSFYKSRNFSDTEDGMKGHGGEKGWVKKRDGRRCEVKTNGAGRRQDWITWGMRVIFVLVTINSWKILNTADYFLLPSSFLLWEKRRNGWRERK